MNTWFPRKTISQPDVFIKAAEEVFAEQGFTLDDVRAMLSKRAQDQGGYYNAADAAAADKAERAPDASEDRLQGIWDSATNAYSGLLDRFKPTPAISNAWMNSQPSAYKKPHEQVPGMRAWNRVTGSSGLNKLRHAPADISNMYYSKPFKGTDVNPYLAYGIPEGEDAQKVTYGTEALAMDEAQRMNRLRQLYARQLFPGRAAAIDAGKAVAPMTYEQKQGLNRFFEAAGMDTNRYAKGARQTGDALALPTYESKTGMDAARHWAEQQYDMIDPGRAKKRAAGEEVTPLTDEQVNGLWETYRPEGHVGRYKPGAAAEQTALTYHPQQYREPWMNSNFFGAHEKKKKEPAAAAPGQYTGTVTDDLYWRDY